MYIDVGGISDFTNSGRRIIIYAESCSIHARESILVSRNLQRRSDNLIFPASDMRPVVYGASGT